MHSLLLFLSPNHSVAVRSHPCCFISPPVIYPWFDLMHLFETFIEALCSFLHIWRVLQFCYHCLAMRCSRNHVCNLLPSSLPFAHTTSLISPGLEAIRSLLFSYSRNFHGTSPFLRRFTCPSDFGSGRDFIVILIISFLPTNLFMLILCARGFSVVVSLSSPKIDIPNVSVQQVSYYPFIGQNSLSQILSINARSLRC